jgi:hypothetical protein
MDDFPTSSSNYRSIYGVVWKFKFDGEAPTQISVWTATTLRDFQERPRFGPRLVIYFLWQGEMFVFHRLAADELARGTIELLTIIVALVGHP